MERTVKAVIRKGESQYVAECLGLSVITQGRTLDETVAHLREAVELHLADEDPADFGLTPDPIIMVMIELEPTGRAAYAG